jgi:AcrR family transcriptional regulator
LLAAASDLLATAGPDALTVRAIADRAGCSTMGVYTHFGGKDGVVEALFVEGFQRLGTAMASVAVTDDPLADLRASCASYRRFALDNPTHYIVMFEAHVPGFEPSEESMLHAHATLVQLESRVQRCLDARAIDSAHGDAQEIAYAVWANGHGLMSLELHRIGKRDDYDARHRTATATMFAGLTHPPLPEP